MTQPKIAFYPCCGSDTLEPAFLLGSLVDRFIFCDIKKSKLDTIGDNNVFIEGDAYDALINIKYIDVLFYRRDSKGEGGSGVFVLGDRFLSALVSKFPPEGGMIVTDGSNSRGGNFKRMIRKNGLYKFGNFFCLYSEQFLEPYDLKIISVSRHDL